MPTTLNNIGSSSRHLFQKGNYIVTPLRRVHLGLFIMTWSKEEPVQTTVINQI